MEELSQTAQRILDSQPFSGLIGAKLAKFSEGEAVLEITIREELMQQNGFVHGGVVSYAADNALTFAGGSALGPAVLTSEYKINYLKPARGELLRARAEVIQASKRQAVCRCEIFAVGEDQSEMLCAVAQGTIVAVATEGAFDFWENEEDEEWDTAAKE
ncbi:MAG: PaaI family thioesterase [Rubrobacteraceae bacterium]